MKSSMFALFIICAGLLTGCATNQDPHHIASAPLPESQEPGGNLAASSAATIISPLR